MTRWSNTRILGLCGLTAAILGTVGGFVGGWFPRMGHVLSGLASAIMLGANIVLIVRRER